MVVRNEDKISVSMVFYSPIHADKIHKMHTLVQLLLLYLSHNVGTGLLEGFVVSFFHPSYSTPFNSILLSTMILHKHYLSKCQNEKNVSLTPFYILVGFQLLITSKNELFISKHKISRFTVI